MIYDSIEHADRYTAGHAGLEKAFEFLRSGVVNDTLLTGRHLIDGERVFAGVDRYATKPASEAMFEAHRRYADIQVVVSGRETLLWAPLADMQESLLVRPFDPAKDVAKWQLPAEYLSLPLFPGRFVVLFPEDAHAPGVHAAGSPGDEVLKVVFKVALD